MNKIEKLELIKSICEEHNITGYEIGKHTNISSFAAHKILTGATKNPNETTVNEILTFLETAITGTNIKKLEEPKAEYLPNTIDNLIEEKLEKVFKPYFEKLEKAMGELILDVDDCKELLKKTVKSING